MLKTPCLRSLLSIVIRLPAPDGGRENHRFRSPALDHGKALERRVIDYSAWALKLSAFDQNPLTIAGALCDREARLRRMPKTPSNG